MDKKVAVDVNELEQVASGWEFQSDNKYHEWLNGYNIKCPYCGNEDKDVVEKKAASRHEILFRCQHCQRSFFLRDEMLYNRIKVITD